MKCIWDETIQECRFYALLLNWNIVYCFGKPSMFYWMDNVW